MNGVLAAVAAITVGVLTIIGDHLTSENHKDVELVKVLFERVEALETQYEGLIATNQTQAMNITKLKIQLATKYEPDEAVKEYIDNMPFPAWVKVVQGDLESPVFVMWYLNEAFEDFTGIPKEKYIGKTAFDLYPEEVAMKFQLADEEVLKEFSSLCVTRPRTDKGNREHTQVCKWPTKVRGKDAVAGQMIFREHDPCQDDCEVVRRP